jgi:hypothetical protein
MRILLPVIFLCAAAFGEDGMIAIKSNKPDTIIQVRKEITSEGKVTQLWINIGTTSKDGSYLLLKMPIGVHRIKLSKDGYLPIITNITVDKKINKIEYELDKEMNDINIIFLHEGWQVYVDGNPYLDDDKPVFAPASIVVSKGKHEIRLVKDGFNDIVKNVNGEDTVEIKDKPVEGRSTIVKKGIKKEPKEEKKEMPIWINKVITIELASDSQQCLGQKASLCFLINKHNISKIENVQFIIRPGLADNKFVSFESISEPKSFLRHQYSRVKLHRLIQTDLYKKDATFQIIYDSETGYISLVSFNYPDMVISVDKNDEVWISNNPEKNKFKFIPK